MSSVMLGLLAAVAAVSAAANWWSRWGEHTRSERVAMVDTVELISKPVATVAIGAIGVTLAVTSDAHHAAPVVVFAVLGFLLCLGGDVALLPSVDRFVVGLASFLAGHVAFVVMFVLLGLDQPVLAVPAIAATALLAATLGRRIVTSARAADPGLGLPVLAYLAVISTMAIVGWATGIPAAIVGSTLFITSDSILGWRRFVAERWWMSIAVMVTYHLALVGLALSLA